ncbi:MAG: phosphoribosylamine--glycine ligase [Synergistaceae bacterium]|nr:phosphoribosylamine--glycine ligase [Synergistaceae bacterium]
MRSGINTLVLGGGGREHALVHFLSKSKIIGELHCVPGNPGMEHVTIHETDPCDVGTVLSLCEKYGIGLIVVGPEAPLVAGVSDRAREAGIAVFGPGKDGAKLEGSKAFAKDFMRRHGIPTAPFAICRTPEECEAALSSRRPPFVIKADGLAAGKGVFLPKEIDEARVICRDLLSGKSLGDAGRTLVIEDYLPGSELTVFAVTDGKAFTLLPPSRDHKRAYDGDLGPNTGGMGAYAPVMLPEGLLGRVTDEVLKPTLAGLAADGIDYRGVIYMGLMLNGEGGETRVSVVEYNARFGDPEIQAVLPLLTGDLGTLIQAAANGTLGGHPVMESEGSALCVVLTSGGYPGDFVKGMKITGIGRKDDGEDADTYVFHSGTAFDGEGNIVTNGGRVLSVVGTGETFAAAREKAYRRIRTLSFENMHYRSDIGYSEI